MMGGEGAVEISFDQWMDNARSCWDGCFRLLLRLRIGERFEIPQNSGTHDREQKRPGCLLKCLNKYAVFALFVYRRLLDI